MMIRHQQADPCPGVQQAPERDHLEVRVAAVFELVSHGDRPGPDDNVRTEDPKGSRNTRREAQGRKTKRKGQKDGQVGIRGAERIECRETLWRTKR